MYSSGLFVIILVVSCHTIKAATFQEWLLTKLAHIQQGIDLLYRVAIIRSIAIIIVLLIKCEIDI